MVEMLLCVAIFGIVVLAAKCVVMFRELRMVFYIVLGKQAYKDMLGDIMPTKQYKKPVNASMRKAA